ncbi:hypothetical protein NG895_29580 [Aeoliella sp. ICT_H6.2]|uniref:Laminin IV type A domain-containing protein n=1 Tax=Aeoliella straminimaris TaxID=2954799 RepID=A0A9X2JKC7_9BACT|nr:laminin B domain-containing protein [Aeoliella straminimaris]MCO6048073.1 hypothetical protein [Aeoliella straminimaris]
MLANQCDRLVRLVSMSQTLVVGLAVATTASGVESRFDADAEGWIITDDGQAAGEPARYSDGGHIFHQEGLFATDDWYFRAPAKFRGNFSSAYGAQLEYDLRQSGTGEDFELDEIYLRGGGLTLTMQTAPPGQSWTSYSIPLVESAGWKLNSRSPTQDELLAVLANLTDLQIRGEFQFGSDTGYLDNVVLPEFTSPRVVGDYDRNGVVDAEDYQLWKSTFGSTDILLADGDASGSVDLADYPVWRNNLGAALPANAAVNAVPEPSPLWFGLAAVCCGLLLRWLL